jgi:ligand-binding SRPBCC domain-containing protein
LGYIIRRTEKGEYGLLRFRTFRSSQWIPRSPEEVFAFFSDANNLEAITPPWLNFKVLTPGSIRLASGTEILYKLRLHGIPMKWTTQIRRWAPPQVFSDAQLSGPYRLWYHTHTFKPANGGTQMTDVVRYSLPFGMLGRIIDILQTRREVEMIFAYRADRIAERFGRLYDTL